MNPNENRNHIAYVRGDRAFSAGRFTEAIAWFKEAVAEWDEDWQAHFALGNSYSEARKFRRAEAAYRDALRLAPEKERANIQFNLGNALFDQGRVADSIAMLESIPPGDPVRGKAMRNIAWARKRGGG